MGARTWVTARRLNPGIVWEASYPAWRGIVGIAVGITLGTTAALMLTREKHLFRYFKNR